MENILLKNVARGIKYGVKPRMVTSKWKFSGDKVSHVGLLKEKYNLTIENIKAIKAQNEDAVKGYYVEFSGDSKSVFPLKAFENANIGIRLLNVKAEEDTLKATVYIPEEKEYKFNDKFESYEQTLSEEKQRAQDFVESVNDISAATLKSFWTSKTEYMPNEVSVWCELWVRYEATKKENLEYVRAITIETLQKLEITYKEQFIEFPERLVFLIKANRQKLEELIQRFPYVAELQKAAEVNTFFTELSSREQSEFITDLISRKHTDLSSNVSVCLLDSGVNKNHALLSDYITYEDSVLEGYNEHDSDGHGSVMAGIVLYNNLGPLLENSDSIIINHTIDSVKIYTKNYPKDDPDLYGEITKRAVYSAEIANPESKRVICMAVTSPEIDNPDNGEPSSWSADLDKIIFNQENDDKRLFLVSAGNIYPQDYVGQKYPDPNIIHTVQNPSQALNALTIGAYAGIDIIKDTAFKGFNPLVDRGNLSPYSTTSAIWSRWAIKPEVLFDGGNMCTNGADVSDCEDLSLLTTSKDGSKLTTINATSSATAQAAWFASQINVRYPDIWPETVRALMVHSAEWTDNMKRCFLKDGDSKTNRKNLLRTCGYGIPNLPNALECMNNSVNLVIQDEIQPFIMGTSSITYNEMRLIDLPWAKDQLRELENTPVKLKITLSYYIEPSPGKRGWKEKYTYSSFGLKFEIKNENETEEEFIRRIDFAMQNEDETSVSSNNDIWYLGKKNRDKGCIRSDFTVNTTAIQIAEIDKIAIIPENGWWKNRRNTGRYNNKARYSLIVTISTPDKNIDLYTPIITKIKSAVEVII